MGAPLELRPMRPAELDEFLDQLVRDRARNTAFALGLVLFIVTLALNFVALKIVQKYREQYD